MVALAVLALTLIWPPPAGAQNPTPTPDLSFFVGQVRVLPRPNAATGPQEVEGFVRGISGPIAGTRIRVRWPGGGAETGSAADGRFKFTLTPGTFQMELLDLPSRPLEFVVAANQQVRVEFVELRDPASLSVQTSTPTAAGGTPSPTVSGTASPSVSGTPSPTVSGTPSRSVSGTPSPTPSASPSPTPTATKTPVLTPVPAIGTPIVLRLAPSPAALTAPGPAPRQSLLPELSSLSISVEPWLSWFLFGSGIGAGLVVVGVFVALLRR